MYNWYSVLEKEHYMHSRSTVMVTTHSHKINHHCIHFSVTFFLSKVKLMSQMNIVYA